MNVKAFETPNLGVIVTEVTEETDIKWFVKNPKFLQMIPQKAEDGREVLNPILPPVIYKEILTDGVHITSFDKSKYVDITDSIRFELIDLYKRYEGYLEEVEESENVVDLFGDDSGEEASGDCGEGCCGCKEVD